MADDSSDDDVSIRRVMQRRNGNAKKELENKEEEVHGGDFDDDEGGVNDSSSDEGGGDEEDEEDEEEEGAGGGDEDDDDDVPISELVKKKEEAEDDDSDVPLSELIAAKKKSASTSVKKVEPKKPASPKKRKAAEPPAIKRKKTTGVNHESVVYETNKGKLVQALLRRWWYAIDWPSKEARSKVPEENFEVLSGFPGVHVCTSGPRLGELVDHRDHDAAPSFVNLYAKPAKELKELVATAFESQINQLKNHEPDSPMIPGLQKEMKGAAKINADKADVEARKAFAEYQKNTQGRR